MNAIFIIIAVLAVAIFVFVCIMMFSSKMRGKMMSKLVKSTKYMVDESKDDIKSISTNIAEAQSEGTEITARAIKKGFAEEESIFCKHCGAKIDKDSKFCNKCGKEI